MTESVTGTEERTAAEEAGLVAQIATGEVEAPVGELYRRYSKRLYRFGVQSLGDSGLAEEMVQETFVRLWRTAGRFDSARGSVGASGDLAPLAHLALPLVGEGEAFLEGERMPGLEALTRAGLEPVQLAAKEGL